jgi:signal peptidase I
MKAKEMWKKFWDLLWKDDSWKGWVFSIIFIFIFIKFIFFPLLSLTTGTILPLAIVESCSMYHEGNLISNPTEWWEDHDSKYLIYGISKKGFESFEFKKGFNKGDILFVIGANPNKLEVGDVIIFEAGYQNPLIHRIVKISEKDGEKIFSTRGDNNNGQLQVEKEIKEGQLIGKAVFRLAPYLGWTKLIFFEGLRPIDQRGFCNGN